MASKTNRVKKRTFKSRKKNKKKNNVKNCPLHFETNLFLAQPTYVTRGKLSAGRLLTQIRTHTQAAKTRGSSRRAPCVHHKFTFRSGSETTK